MLYALGRHTAPLLLFALAAAYALYAWRYCGVMDGDHGRWMYEVSRFALGERIYTELPWQYPPLALVLYGTLASWLSPKVATLNALSTLLYALLCGMGYLLFRRTLDRGAVLPASVATLAAFAFHSMHHGGAPVPVGTYTPAHLVGAVLWVGLALAVLRSRHNPTPVLGFGMGLVAAALFLTKQDFWPSVGVLLGFACLPWQTRPTGFRCTLLGTCVVAVAFALLSLYAYTGGEGLWAGLTGFGQLRTAHAIPSPFLFSRNFFLAGSLFFLFTGVGLALGLRPFRGTRLFGFVALGVLLALPGLLSQLPQGKGEGAQWLLGQWVQSFVPLLLAPLGLLSLARYRFSLTSPQGYSLALFTSLFIACRARNGFDGYAWFFPLVDLPFLALALEGLWGEGCLTQKAVRLLFWGFAAIHALFLCSNHKLPRALVRLDTAQGPIRTKPHVAETFQHIRQRLRELDHAGASPVLPLPYQSLNYFLGKRDPTGMTQGLELTLTPTSEVLERIRQARPIILMSQGQLFRSFDHHRDKGSSKQALRQYADYLRALESYTPDPRGPIGPWIVYLPVSHVWRDRSFP